MEADWNNCDADLDEDFSLLQPLDLITKDVHEFRQIISERREKLHKERRGTCVASHN
jgi:transducin (beta)-like 1